VNRLGLTSRIFCLAAILGLSLAFVDTQGLRSTILLGAVASITIAAETGSRLPHAWTTAAEAALAALVIGLVLPDSTVAVPYLVVPAIVAGATRGWRPVAAVVSIELFDFVLLAATNGDFEALRRQAPVVAPWLFTALGVGLLSAWVRGVRTPPAATATDPSYESARRLLSQLRTVARRLSSGLDTVSMASHVLSSVNDALGDSRSAVFVRSDGGVLVPIAYRGTVARERMEPDDHLVRACWDEMEPVQEPTASGLASARRRVALPLRVGSRMIGLVLAECRDAPAGSDLTRLMQDLDDQSLRLDTAMVFDEVRSIATVEERHRLAREIHDGVAQEVASLGYAVDDLLARTVEADRRRDILAIRGEVTRLVSELRLSIFDLRSQVTPSAGLGSALSDYVRQVGARSNMTVHLTLDESPTRLRAETETELLRIAQEAITNARKHSGARNLWVHCTVRPPHARVQVRDDGKGLGHGREDSYGMRIMRERAHRIQAELRVDTGREAASGTTVLVTLGDESAGATVERTEDQSHERARH
jgi:signal transduction histidine kinase